MISKVKAEFFVCFVLKLIFIMSSIGHYSNTQEKILLGLNVFASICSFLGASFIIGNYCLFASFRNNLAFKLILFVAIGDIINSVGNFMGTPQDIKEVCIMQGLIIQFGDLVSFGWVTAIAWVIYTVITREEPPTKEDVQIWYKRIHFVIWPTATILTILPLTTQSYGPSGGLYVHTHTHIILALYIDQETLYI